MAKALVTGGTGFVGSHLAHALHRAGHEVRVLHRSTSKLTALAGLPYEPALGDILDEESLRAACTDCDWVFHVAAVSAYWRTETDRMMHANVEGTRRVLAAARDTGVRRVIFTSSGGALGMRNDGQPVDESLDFNLSPQRFPYGYSKHRAELVVREAVAAGQDVVTVNPVVVMGPGDLNMISGTFITQIKRLGPLVPVTSGGIGVTDVRDVARWHIAAAEQGRSGERYILWTANYTHAEWYAMIAQTVAVLRPRFMLPDPLAALVADGIGLARRFGIATPVDANQARLATHKVYFDGHKAWHEFGPPRVDMWQSLRDTYAWYRDQGLA